MISAQDIHSVTFEKSMRGYRTEEVDEYLDKLAQEVDAMAKEKADMEKKLYILADKVDQYRKDEETLKTALLNAQRLGETVVYEAKQKAETIIYDANSKASQAKEEAAERVATEEMALAKLQSEVSRFKNDILNLYKQHIESLSAIPGVEEKRQAAPVAEPVAEVQDIAVQPDEPIIAEPSAKTEEFRLEAIDPAASAPAEPPMFDHYQGIRFDD